MGIGLLAGQLVLVLCFTIFTLKKYAGLSNHQHSIILIPTFLGWFFSFLIIIVLPLDVAITFYKKCLSENVAVPAIITSTAKITTAAFSFSEFDDNDQDNSNNIPSLPIISTTPFIEHENNSMLCDEPKGYVEDRLLFGLWRIVYWGSQLLTWILLPMIQSYAKAGEFTVKGRLKYAFYSNFVYYGLYFTSLMFLLFYVVSHGVSLDFTSLKVLVVSASNSWGIFLLVILLGYGLIEVPRHFWRLGMRGYRLQQTYFEIDKLSSEKNEAEEAINEAYRETKNALNLLKDTRGAARDKVKQIAAKFPNEFVKEQQQLQTKVRDSVTNECSNWQQQSRQISQLNVDAVSQNTYLVKLHRKVIIAGQTYQRCQVQWRSLIELAFYLEDLEVAEGLGKLPSKWAQISDSTINLPNTKRGRTVFPLSSNPNPLMENMRFLWHIRLQRPVFQFLAIIFFAMTILVLWSECTFFIVHPQLSLAARLLHGAARGDHYKFIQIGAITMILYLCICSYYTIFRLRIYRYYRLDSTGMTDDNSLIFSAMLLCRLTAPMCLNFLGMIHLDSAITKNRNNAKIQTQFTKLMGHLDIIPWLAEGINIYLPIVILLLCLATWFRLGTRFLHNLGIDQFLEDDEMTLEMVRSGKALVSLERNRVNRARNREERNETWRANASAAEYGQADGPKNTSYTMDWPTGSSDHLSEGSIIETTAREKSFFEQIDEAAHGTNIELNMEQQSPYQQQNDGTNLININSKNFFDDL